MEASQACQTFLNSMKINHDEWVDGTGYNLEALGLMTEAEREQVVPLLAKRLETSPDWREIEALKALRTPEARYALIVAMSYGNLDTRLRATEALRETGEPVDLESILVETLTKTDLMTGLSHAIDVAAEHPSPRVQETLLDRALNGNDDQRIHCAALALFHGGKADEPFDWNHRPFFLRFVDENRRTQIEAYRELCQRLGVAPKSSGSDTSTP